MRRVIVYTILFLIFCPLVAVGQDVVVEEDSRVEKNEPVYKNPQFEIISQNKKQIVFTFIWDEDVKVKIEIVSIIGNTFFYKEFLYKGKECELTVAVDKFPTGIYLLKMTDEKGRVVVRKFTKY